MPILGLFHRGSRLRGEFLLLNGACFGAPGGIRTHNRRLRRPLLYPLSYGGAGYHILSTSLTRDTTNGTQARNPTVSRRRGHCSRLHALSSSLACCQGQAPRLVGLQRLPAGFRRLLRYTLSRFSTTPAEATPARCPKLGRHSYYTTPTTHLPAYPTKCLPQSQIMLTYTPSKHSAKQSGAIPITAHMLTV